MWKLYQNLWQMYNRYGADIEIILVYKYWVPNNNNLWLKFSTPTSIINHLRRPPAYRYNFSSFRNKKLRESTRKNESLASWKRAQKTKCARSNVPPGIWQRQYIQKLTTNYGSLYHPIIHHQLNQGGQFFYAAKYKWLWFDVYPTRLAVTLAFSRTLFAFCEEFWHPRPCEIPLVGYRASVQPRRREYLRRLGIINK